MQVHLLPIRFGFSRPDAIPTRHKVFCQRLAHACFGNAASPESIELVGDTSVPIPSERSVGAESVADVILAALPDEDLSYILLDLGGPDEKDVSRPNVLLGATVVINKIRATRPAATVAMILPRSLNDGDHIAPTVHQAANHLPVRIVSCEGAAYGPYFDAVPLPAQKVRDWAAEARLDPHEGLRAKLIRRVGQYKLPDYDAIIRQFYDGSCAFDEIYEIVGRVISEKIGADPKVRIGYDVRHAEWFRKPVEAALRRAGLTSTIAIENADDIEALAELDFLMVPIVRSGRALSGLFSGYAARTRMPKIWSLLATEGGSPTEGVRQVSISSDRGLARSVSIQYALKVDAGTAAPDRKFWEQCSIKPIVPDEEAFGSGLTSDAMWGMIFEAGITLESPVPPHRESLGYVPRFGKIAELNGPFIASKFDAMLRTAMGGSLPPSIGFLCPAEPNATDLARSLRDLAGHDTVMVGRDLINSRIEGQAAVTEQARIQLEEVRPALEAWQKLVRHVSAAETPQIVLLDEFELSGRTFRGLYNLANEFQLPVLCAISLASYSVADDDRTTGPVPRLTLYHMGQACRSPHPEG